MSTALSLSHGPYGRAALYLLDRPMVAHAHREAHMFFYISGEPGAMCVSGKALSVDPVSAVAISPWEQHSFEPVAGRSGLYLVLYIRPEWFGGVESLTGGSKSFTFGQSMISLAPSTARWVQRLGDLLVENENSSEIDNCLYETMSRCYHHSWKGERQLSIAGHHQQRDRRISHAIELMNDCFTSEVEMDWLARSSALSRPHFFKLFKKEIGVTPNVYLNTLRSERAIDDLLGTSKSMTAIGLDLGFSSQASFTRFFSSNVGIAPTDYRRVALGV